MNTFFIADTHFGDERIIKYENRPFENAQKMDETLIANWNDVVEENDEVWVLGDFGAEGYEKEILSSLNGIKSLVRGNHDLLTNSEYREIGFTEVYDRPIVLDNFWILSHEPMYVNENMPYVNLFGHIHNSPIIKDYSSHHFVVSAERINYTPINFSEIKKILKEEKSNGANKQRSSNAYYRRSI